MNRKFFVLTLTGVVMLFASSAFASYIDQLTDLSAEWIGNPTRTAATDGVDAVVYNPAGTVKMENGLHVHFSNQSIDNNNTTEVTGKGYDGNTKYETHKPSKFVPSFFVNYRQDDWSVFGGAYILGGGGSVLWENGTPNLNLAVQTVERVFGANAWSNGKTYFGTDTTSSDATNANVSVEMLSMFPALALGGGYKVNDMISVSLGGRVVKGSQTITIKANEAGIGGSNDTLYDAEWEATGFMGVASVDIQPIPELNIGLTYESLTKMEWEVNVDKDLSAETPFYGDEHALSSASGYTDGRKFRFDLPAKLMAGAEYAVVPTFKLALSGLVYFTNWGTYEKPTKSSNLILDGEYKQNVTKYDLDLAWEIGAGFSWEFLKNVFWTGGVNYDCMNVKDEYLSEIMNKVDLWNVGTGLKIKTEHNLNLMVSYMHNFYITRSNEYATDGTDNYKTEYSKYANVLAFSVEYKFL